MRHAAKVAALMLTLACGPFIGSAISASADSGSQATALTGASPSGPFFATIRRTSHGIPHISGDDYADVAFGYGYAFTQDNICVLAKEYVTVNGERSRYFGPNGSYVQGGNGFTNNNLNSDFFFKRIKESGVIDNLVNKPPPLGPRQEIKDAVSGFVAGYNKYLNETGVDNLSDPSCRGAPWVRPITELDAYLRFYQLGLLASAGAAIDGIGAAQPPVGAGPTPPTPAEQQQMIGELGQRLPLGGVGSNAVALGSDATDNGKGMMLGNPHFPWDGSERFYEAQLTIPGKVDVEGASLFGVPVINIGHTTGLAWSHTVSTGYRFTPFELKLVPGSPTTYIYDSQPTQMKAETVTVDAKKADGTLEQRTRTLYSSVHGPIMTAVAGQNLFPWTPATAWAMGDANADNFRYLNHFFDVNQAQSVQQLHNILVQDQGIPWVNTIAADSTGQAYYADISVVPHVTDEQAQTCDTELGQATFAALRLPVLDGSRSSCRWGTDADAVEPGIFGPSHLPELYRRDYTENSNDSYWLANPNQPLTGFAKIIGDEDTERSLRTRLGLIMIAQQLSGGNRFTLQQLQDMVFNDRQYAGELWRDELVAFCNTHPTVTASDGSSVDVSQACPVLAAWDLHDNLDSAGAVLFRRFASRALAAVGLKRPPGIFDQEYTSGGDPINTPRGLNTDNPRVQQAFADAVQEFQRLGIPLAATLRSYQTEDRNGEAIPIHGGPGTVGVFNAINVRSGDFGAQGWTSVPHGSSFVMAAQFTSDPNCPVDTRTILTYSQSTNPSSPYYGDQTRMFSQKQWVDEAFCESEIAADPNLQVTRISTVPAADLSVTNSDSPDPVPAGERLTYTVTVTNNGPDGATSVSLTDTLDRSLRVGSARPSQGRCTLRRTTVQCSLGDLAQGASATVSIVVRPTRKGTVSSTASVEASQPSDPDTSNNTDTETTTIKP